MKIRFLKAHGIFNQGAIHLVNKKFGLWAIENEIAVLADSNSNVSESPLSDIKGTEEEQEAKKKPTTRRRQKKDTQSK